MRAFLDRSCAAVRFARTGAVVLSLAAGLAGAAFAQKGGAQNFDVRVSPATGPTAVAKAPPAGVAEKLQALGRAMAAGLADFKASLPGAEVQLSDVTGAVEVVSAAGTLTGEAPGVGGFEIVRGFLQKNAALYGLSETDLANLHFIGESVSAASGLRMVRVEQMVNGLPVFQSETRFTIDKEGRLIRSVGLLVPGATASAPAPAAAITAQQALISAMGSVGISVPAGKITATVAGKKVALAVDDPKIKDKVTSGLVYFPIQPGVLVAAWSQTTFTSEAQDWYTVTDATTGTVLWRKGMRSHAGQPEASSHGKAQAGGAKAAAAGPILASVSQDARFSVYVQADGTTPADSPAPLSPTTATVGSNFQPPSIARKTVSMLAARNPVASPNGWIPDGGNTTTGNNVDAYLDRDNDDLDDPGTLDNRGRPTGNVDANGRNRDFLGTGFSYTPPPTVSGADTGTLVTDAQAQRGAVTHLFYVANWYHDRMYAFGFDEAAGNFQTINFGSSGAADDPVLAEVQDDGATGGSRNNANFSTPPDGTSGRMQMYIFDFPQVDRDGSLDAEIVLHELTHGLTNRLIGNGAGLDWDIGGGMGEGWSDFYGLSLLNNTNADDPNGRYATGAYATYKLGGLLDNYVYGIRRFPYCTDNTVNPLTWADVDDITNNLSGGIAPSPISGNSAGACEVHNIGEVWAMTLWEVRSRIIADTAGANGDVPTGNNRTLQIVTDALKMTPINPSFVEARDAILAADAATNAAANEASIWAGFADRGLGYNAVAPYSRLLGYRAGHVGIGESFDVPYLDVQSVAIDDSPGNGNGAIDPNEPVQITVKLKNPWRRASFGVPSATATLTSSTSGVTITNGTATYGAIPALGSTDGTKFQLRVPSAATAGQALQFTINVTSALGTKAVNFTLRVGRAAGTGTPVTYTRNTSLAIPDATPRGVFDTLTITDDYEIADLNVRVTSLPHTYPGDLTVGIKGPNGLGIDLVSVIGGGVSGGGTGNSLTNLIVDDQASGDLLTAPGSAAPYSRSWKPIFNTPSWVTVAGFAFDPVGCLSRFNGLSTQGAWKMIVSDQVSVDTGSLNGWSLIVTPRAFTVAPFLDTAPALTTTATALSYQVNQTAQTIDNAVTVTDSSNPNLAGATVSITAGFVAGEDVLAFANQNGITGSFDAANGVLTLTGTATLLNYRAALRTVTYRNTSSAPASTTRTVTFAASDGYLMGSATRNLALVPAFNDAPVFTKGSDQATDEDGGPRTVANWATGISAGPSDEAGQGLDFIVSNDQPSLFASQPAIDASGQLTYTAAPDASGAATVTVQIHDNGGTADGGVDTSPPQTFKITIRALNDAPTFVKGDDQLAQPVLGLQTVVGWATAISAGPADESGQAVNFGVSVDSPALFSTTPAVAPNGDLSYALAPGTHGVATVTVSLHDNGGTPGVDLSAPQMFQITTPEFNAAPRFTVGPDQFVERDAGLKTVTGWATGISPGGPSEAGQTLNFLVDIDNPALFATPPTVSPEGTLVYAPTTAASGTATITVRLHDDGGVANGGIDTSAPQTFHITVSTLADVLGAYNGLASAAGGAAASHERSGLIKVNFTKTGAFTGRLVLAGHAYTLSGRTDKTGAITFGPKKTASLDLKRLKASTLSLSLSLDTTLGTSKLSGSITDATAAFAAIDADRTGYTAARKPIAPLINVPADLLGRYTVLFPAKTLAEQGLAASAFPQGDGVGTLTISTAGTAKLTGTLADGTKISYSNALSKANTWPVYVSLARAKGALTGPAKFEDRQKISDLDGLDLHWFKPPSTAKIYGAGWLSGIKVDLLGAKYVVPPRLPAQSVFPKLPPPAASGNASIEFTGGNLPQAGVSKAFNLSTADRVTVIQPGDDKLRLTITRGTGLIGGSFVDAATRHRSTINAVVFQKQFMGSGFFLGTSESGPVTVSEVPPPGP